MRLPDDELDGCDLDFSPNAVSDDELLSVVFGDDPEQIECYRELFAK